MKLEVNWNCKMILILIDSGSTHSFIDSRLPTQLANKIDHKARLRVMVANREKITSLGTCRNISLNLGLYSFSINLLILPLSGFDVVLGVNWLKTLKPIL